MQAVPGWGHAVAGRYTGPVTVYRQFNKKNYFLLEKKVITDTNVKLTSFPAGEKLTIADVAIVVSVSTYQVNIKLFLLYQPTRWIWSYSYCINLPGEYEVILTVST